MLVFSRRFRTLPVSSSDDRVEDWPSGCRRRQSARYGEAVAFLDALEAGKKIELMFWGAKEKIIRRMKRITHVLAACVSFTAVLMRELARSSLRPPHLAEEEVDFGWLAAKSLA